jgi:hypothetical protein
MNFIIKNWRGELPLWKSYWIAGFAGSLALAVWAAIVVVVISAISGLRLRSASHLCDPRRDLGPAAAVFRLAVCRRLAFRRPLHRGSARGGKASGMGVARPRRCAPERRDDSVRLCEAGGAATRRDLCDGAPRRPDASAVLNSSDAKQYGSRDHRRLQIWPHRCFRARLRNLPVHPDGSSRQHRWTDWRGREIEQGDPPASPCHLCREPMLFGLHPCFHRWARTLASQRCDARVSRSRAAGTHRL